MGIADYSSLSLCNQQKDLPIGAWCRRGGCCGCTCATHIHHLRLIVDIAPRTQMGFNERAAQMRPGDVRKAHTPPRRSGELQISGGSVTQAPFWLLCLPIKLSHSPWISSLAAAQRAPCPRYFAPGLFRSQPQTPKSAAKYGCVCRRDIQHHWTCVCVCVCGKEGFGRTTACLLKPDNVVFVYCWGLQPAGVRSVTAAPLDSGCINAAEATAPSIPSSTPVLSSTYYDLSLALLVLSDRCNHSRPTSTSVVSCFCI